LFSFQENYHGSVLEKQKAGLLVHIMVFMSCVLKKSFTKYEVKVAALVLCREISVTFLLLFLSELSDWRRLHSSQWRGGIIHV
jgi:hypothetical protein